MVKLTPRPLTAEHFAAYGEVIGLQTATQLSINDGLTTRYHDLATIDIAAENGRALISVFHTAPIPLPHRVRVLERHPLGSQTFIPITTTPFLLLVGDVNRTPLTENELHLFITNGHQGVNLHKNTWHHHQLVLHHPQHFFVIDRGGDGMNQEETTIDEEIWIPVIGENHP